MRKGTRYQLKIRGLSLLCLSLWPLLSHADLTAQQSNGIYHLHDIQQSRILNPSVALSCKWYMGLPGLSSMQFSYNNTAFSWSDLTGGNRWNLAEVESQMHRSDLYEVEAFLQLFALAHRRREYTFSFQVNERFHLRQTVPGDLATLLVHGNEDFIGDLARFDAFRPYSAYYREYALGVSKPVNSRWRAGIRGKLLFGKAGIRAPRSDMSLFTDADNFHLVLDGAYQLQASFPLRLELNDQARITGIRPADISYTSFLLNRSNPGLALDLGIIYRHSDKLTLSASVLDLGMIRWRSDVSQLQGSGTFNYSYADPSRDVFSMAYLEEVLDTLQSAFTYQLIREPFTSFLSPRIYLGLAYQTGEKTQVGAVLRSTLLRSKWHKALTLSASTRVAKNLILSGNWSLSNHSVKQVGSALAWTGKGFQFFLASDNLLAFFYPFDSRSFHMHWGLNLLLGCSRNKREIQQNQWGKPAMEGVCYGLGKEKRRKFRRL